VIYRLVMVLNAAVKVRYYQWVAKGIFQTLLEKVAAEPDLEWLMVDATHIRAHAQAAGARHKKGALKPCALVVQKVDLTSKIHMACDAMGLPMRMVVDLSPYIVLVLDVVF